jgi:hypothetical protein
MTVVVRPLKKDDNLIILQTLFRFNPARYYSSKDGIPGGG